MSILVTLTLLVFGVGVLGLVLVKTSEAQLTLGGSAFRFQLPGILLTIAGIGITGVTAAMWVFGIALDGIWAVAVLCASYAMCGPAVWWFRLREIFEMRHKRDRYRRRARQRALSAVFSDRA